MSLFTLPRKGQTGQNFKNWAVSSINSLIEYLNAGLYLKNGPGILIDRTKSGIIISLEKPAPTAPQQLGASGAVQDLSVSVTGNTAFIGLSGSTATAQFVGTGSVEISGNTNGQIEIDVPGGSGGSAYPVWGNLVTQDIVPTWTGDNMDSFVLANSGYLKINAYPTIQLNDANNWAHEIYVYVYIDGKQVYSLQRNIGISSTDTITFALTDGQHDSGLVPVCAGSTVSAEYYDSDSASPSLTFTLYKDVSA